MRKEFQAVPHLFAGNPQPVQVSDCLRRLVNAFAEPVANSGEAAADKRPEPGAAFVFSQRGKQTVDSARPALTEKLSMVLPKGNAAGHLMVAEEIEQVLKRVGSLRGGWQVVTDAFR